MSESTSGFERVHPDEPLAGRTALNELRDQLLARLPGLVRRIVLYGSRARGDFDPDSDMDVLVVLEEHSSSAIESARSARYEVMERRDFQPLISLLLLSEREWQELSQYSAGLKHAIEQEGLVIWPTT
jgi:predicted nucleotidyltransferase